MIWFKLGWRNLWRNRRRTLIELVSIGGSVFLGVWWNNLAVGTYDKMIDGGVRMGSGHIGIYHKNYLELRKTEQVIGADKLIQELERDPDVTGIYPRLHVPGLVRSSHGSRPTSIMGIDFNREKSTNPLFEPQRIVEGSLPDQKNSKGALIGVALASELELKVGSKFVIMVQGSDGQIVSSLYKVAGLVQSNIREIDSGAVIIDRKKFGEIIGYEGGAHEIGIMLNSSKQIEKVLPQLSKITGKFNHAKAYSWEKAMPALASTVRMDHAGLQIMVIMLYLIVGIGTINTLLMSVIERTREFGMFRAIGLNKSGIRKMVLVEAFVLSIVGVAIGMVLGVLVGIYTSIKGIDVSGLMSEQGVGGTLFEPIMYSAWDIKGMFILGIGMILVTFMASMYPTYRVLKIKPSEAMRIY